MRNFCDCNQGRQPCTCKMEPKLADAVRRFGFVESKPLGGMPPIMEPGQLRRQYDQVYGRRLPENLESRPSDDGAVNAEDKADMFGARRDYGDPSLLPTIERLKLENAALQDLMTKRDMEIDYLCNARPTVLRLDWYCIALATLANIALHFAFV